MKNNIIKDKSFEFSLRVVQLYKLLCNEKKEFVMSKQILRSGTAIGAMIRESEHAESKQDFIHKRAIAQKEANEAGYWLELLSKSNFIDHSGFDSIQKDLSEIQKILASIILTSKQSIHGKQ